MATWEELKAKFEKESVSAPKVGRPDEESRGNTENDTFKLLEDRIRLESERWGTPERAYNTWESRERAIVDITNEYARQFREQSDVAVRTYGNRKFKTYIDPYEGRERRRFLGSLVLGHNHTVSISEFSLTFKPDGGFYLTRNGEPLPLTNVTDRVNRDIRLNSSGDALYVKNSSEFGRILKAIFDPLVKADIIDRGGLPEVRQFFELGQKLKQAKEYKFACGYKSEGIEDMHTRLVFDRVSVTVLNPFYKDDILYHVIPMAEIVFNYVLHDIGLH